MYVATNTRQGPLFSNKHLGRACASITMLRALRYSSSHHHCTSGTHGASTIACSRCSAVSCNRPFFSTFFSPSEGPTGSIPEYDGCYTSQPPWGGFPRSITRQPRGCQYRTVRLRKALGEMFPAPTFSAPTMVQPWRYRPWKIGPGVLSYTP